MIIIVTGSVGTGKTKIARAIARKYNLKYLDLNGLIVKNKLYENYDKKFKTHIVDIKKLNKFLIKLIKKEKDLVIDSHLSHYLNKKYVDLCIVTKCDIKVLKKRLEKRKYSKDKIRENLDAEILDVCLIEALDNQHKIKVIDTTKSFNKNKLNIRI
ncbi:MAG: adenylate kinase family protein [Nanoarchaeota archaeon]